ncbi:MAG: sugar transferase [Ferruginibacter sp.]
MTTSTATYTESITDSPGVLNLRSEFLYIGAPEDNIREYHSFFSKYLQAAGFSDAKELLKNSAILEQGLPELIILDTALNYKELTAFKLWLKQSFDTIIPVIYNETALKADEIKELYKLKLVDDVVNLTATYGRLHIKAKFLKKVAHSLTHRNDDGSFSQKESKEFSSYGKCIVKRTVDVSLSLGAIIFFLPLYALIALAIRLESKGPVFYFAKRAGKGFKIFKFYKFRTMIVDADKKLEELAKSNMYVSTDNGPAFFKVKNDPRITKVGAFLRNTSLDELPQLFNVLKGDMSIVGNRPLPLYEATALTTDEWAERFMAPAGITGLWQISKRGKEDMSTEERIALDINYARTRSIKGDLKIMLQTPTALIQKTNV